MSDEFQQGELFIYVNGNHINGGYQIGKVKCKHPEKDAYWRWYHEGSTAACTPASLMHKLQNYYVIQEETLGSLD